ncbi:antibiotic biosynthesis monooxygenase [bacterium]|nr:antibiotic biosynthesis monooxygenase [bacterium]
MKPTDTVLVTAIYHPNPGYEKEFLTLWNSKVKPIAMEYGASWASIYHNEDTEEFLSSSHWNSKQDAEKLLEDKRYKKALSELNKLSLLPPSKAVCEFLREAA